MPSAFSALLAKKIKFHRQEVLESIGDGVCQDYPNYRDQCGFLRGLEAALALCEEIERAEDR